MSEFKGTKGKVEITKDLLSEFFVIETNDGIDNWHICNTLTNFDIDKANANLIVDAFKVRQQINFELSELLEQRNKMLEMLERMMKNYDKGTQTYIDCQKLIKETNKK